jgi:hypothetical protein
MLLGSSSGEDPGIPGSLKLYRAGLEAASGIAAITDREHHSEIGLLALQTTAACSALEQAPVPSMWARGSKSDGDSGYAR